MKIKYFFPLLFCYLIPTLIIGYGFVIPGTCVETTQSLSLGFLSGWISAVIAYAIGVFVVYKDIKSTQPQHGDISRFARRNR